MDKKNTSLLDKEKLSGKKTAIQKAEEASKAASAAFEKVEAALKKSREQMPKTLTIGDTLQSEWPDPQQRAPKKKTGGRPKKAASGQPKNASGGQKAAPERQKPSAGQPKNSASGQPQKKKADKPQQPAKKAGNGFSNKRRSAKVATMSTPAQIKAAAPRAQRVKLPQKFEPQGDAKLKVIPLGGIEEIGKNLTVIEYGNDILIIDCGIAFPDDEMPGIDLVIPDYTYLQNNREKIRGVVLTHGHEDHIGGLPFFLKQFDVPVYGTRLTLGLLKNKFEEAGIKNAKLYQVEFGDVVKLGCFYAEFIRSSHSIADAAMIAVYTPVGVLLHTGDFKIDNTPILGDPIDLARIAELGKNGVLALLSDSTNSERSGYTMSERKVGESFEGIFKNCTKRIIIATFASNIHRVQQIFECAEKYGRKVAVSGRSMVNNIATAIELGVLSVKDGIMIDIDMIKKYPPDKVVLITTGSQGETMSALYRMAYSEHRQVNLGPGDLVVVSASPIPGNEKFIFNVINELFKLGAEVIYESLAEIHVSGHACREEQKMILSLAKPKYFVPVHGEYRHLLKHAKTGRDMGVAAKNIVIPQLGRCIDIDEKGISLGATVPSGKILVDGLGVGDVGNIVLRDRRVLAEEGLIIVVATIEHSSNTVVSGPDIVSRGFIYVREAEALMDQVRKVAENVFEKCMQNKTRDWTAVKTSVKDSLGQYIFSKTKRRPMILPIIMQI